MKSLFRYLLLIIAAVALGAVPAYLYQNLESQNKESFFEEQWSVAADRSGQASVVGGTQHDFGKVKSGLQCTCEFLVENRGDAILEIWTEQDESAVIKSDLSSKHILIEQGSTYPISFTFDSKNLAGPFNETVSIKTNDSAHGNETLTFSLTGTVE